jgi:large conductance mechanosensitive channel
MRYDAADFYPLAIRRREGIAMDPFSSVRSLDPAKRASSLFDEFKAFAFKGNVIDLAVGVIIGAAFGKIVDSLVKQIIMPLVGVVLPGKQGYLDWKWAINGKEIPYGLFLGEVVNFVIVALALFLFIVKFLGWLMRTRKEEVAATPPLTKDQELLAEIRDLLRHREGAD